VPGRPPGLLSLPKKDFAVLAANLPDLRQSFERLAGEREAHVDVVGHRGPASQAARLTGGGGGLTMR
jgi:hypothetical protein